VANSAPKGACRGKFIRNPFGARISRYDLARVLLLSREREMSPPVED